MPSSAAKRQSSGKGGEQHFTADAYLGSLDNAHTMPASIDPEYIAVIKNWVKETGRYSMSLLLQHLITLFSLFRSTPNLTLARTCTPYAASTSVSCSSINRCGEVASTSWKASMSNSSSSTVKSLPARWAASTRPTSARWEVVEGAGQGPLVRRRKWLPSAASSGTQKSRCSVPPRCVTLASASRRVESTCSSARPPLFSVQKKYICKMESLKVSCVAHILAFLKTKHLFLECFLLVQEKKGSTN